MAAKSYRVEPNVQVLNMNIWSAYNWFSELATKNMSNSAAFRVMRALQLLTPCVENIRARYSEFREELGLGDIQDMRPSDDDDSEISEKKRILVEKERELFETLVDSPVEFMPEFFDDIKEGISPIEMMQMGKLIKVT